LDKKQLSERDICTKIHHALLRQAGWDEMTQLREEVSFTKGRIIVRGKLVTRGKAKRADYILYYKPNIPLAVIEALVADDRLFCVQRHVGILRPSKHVFAPFLVRALERSFMFDQATACATGSPRRPYHSRVCAEC
jgi:hypothetical protein